MSVAIRSKRLISSELSTTLESAVSLPPAPHIVEEPERARHEREAPESRVARWREAPDAGEGRVDHLEHEFTHGRSQS